MPVFPFGVTPALAAPTADQINAAAAAGAQPTSNCTVREWLAGQALMGLCALPNYRMAECVPMAVEGADQLLIELQRVPPPAPPPAPATTTTTATTTAAPATATAMK